MCNDTAPVLTQLIILRSMSYEYQIMYTSFEYANLHAIFYSVTGQLIKKMLGISLCREEFWIKLSDFWTLAYAQDRWYLFQSCNYWSQPHMTCTPPLGFPCRLNSPRCLSAGAHNEVEEMDMGKRRTKEMTCASTSPPYQFPWQLRGFKRCSSLITQKAELASGMLHASSTCEHRSTRDLRALPR
jgi:hypothetical protein